MERFIFFVTLKLLKSSVWTKEAGEENMESKDSFSPGFPLLVSTTRGRAFPLFYRGQNLFTLIALALCHVDVAEGEP